MTAMGRMALDLALKPRSAGPGAARPATD